MELGKKLKGLRIEKGLEPHDMALKLAISETTYRRYERNETTPDINMLEKIATALDKNFLDLLPENILFNNTDQKGGIALAYHSTINQQSEKLIVSLENQIVLLKEKDTDQKQTIDAQNQKIEKLKIQNKDFKVESKTKDKIIADLNKQKGV
jgi:transcriptional regulator with XRE-family HTH domain